MIKNTMKTLLAAGIIAAASSASAQITSSSVSCTDVNYNSSITEKFPEINDACVEVVEYNGELFTRIDAKLRDSKMSGRYRTQIKLNDGSYGPTHHVKKSANVGAWVDGKRVNFADLRPNTDISVYLPHDRFELLADPSDQAMLPETASSMHWMALMGMGLLGFAGVTRRMRKRA